MFILNFRARLIEAIYLFFDNKRRYFAMQVATVPRKGAADPAPFVGEQHPYTALSSRESLAFILPSTRSVQQVFYNNR